MENAVSTLSQEDQDSVKSMLESFSKEQHDELKSFLDEFKSEASSLSETDIGAAFFAKLQEISGQSVSTNVSDNSDNLVDVYA